MIICSYSLFGDYVSVFKILVISVDSIDSIKHYLPLPRMGHLTLLKQIVSHLFECRSYEPHVKRLFGTDAVYQDKINRFIAEFSNVSSHNDDAG